eukprot:4442674-Pyramimonas_sp.AAC.1
MADYVIKWAGGEDKPIFLRELDAFSKTLRSRRDISGQTFKLLAGIDYASAPEYITSLIKASLVAPDSHTHNGTSKLVTSADAVVYTGKGRKSIEKFIDYLRKAKTWTSNIPKDMEIPQATI